MTNTVTDIAGRVASRLGLPADDPDVLAATDAAVNLATIYVYGNTPEVVPNVALDLDEPRHVTGLTALGVRLYKEPDSPAGVLESDSYTGTVIPGDPMSEVHHLFDYTRDAVNAFGIA